jgi:hypothetical protein
VRQQWNFNAPNAIREVEEFQVALSAVTVVELVIVPDISRGAARAPLTRLRQWLLSLIPGHRNMPDGSTWKSRNYLRATASVKIDVSPAYPDCTGGHEFISF